MRCCDCEFRKDCEQIESDIVCFTLCGMRMKKLVEQEMNKKYAEISNMDATERREKE